MLVGPVFFGLREIFLASLASFLWHSPVDFSKPRQWHLALEKTSVVAKFFKSSEIFESLVLRKKAFWVQLDLFIYLERVKGNKRNFYIQWIFVGKWLLVRFSGSGELFPWFFGFCGSVFLVEPGFFGIWSVISHRHFWKSIVIFLIHGRILLNLGRLLWQGQYFSDPVSFFSVSFEIFFCVCRCFTKLIWCETFLLPTGRFLWVSHICVDRGSILITSVKFLESGQIFLG